MNFNPEDEKRLEEMGYLDTMKSFGKFVGENYYIYPPKRPILIDALLSMDATELSKIADTLGLNISGYSRNFAVYSIIVPKISEIVKSTSFESLNLDLLETAAEEFGIDRLVPYTQRELVKVIAQSDRQLHSNFLFFQRNNDEVVESIREICKFIVSKGIICN